MPNYRNVVAKASKAIEDLTRRAAVFAGRERVSEGVKGALVGKDELAVAKDLIARSKEQAKFMRSVGVKQRSTEFPSWKQTLGSFNPGDVVPDMSASAKDLEELSAGSGVTGFMRAFHPREVPPTIQGYTIPQEGAEQTRPLRRILMPTKEPFGEAYSVYGLEELGRNNGTPVFIDPRRVKTPHQFAHTTAHELQHQLRDQYVGPPSYLRPKAKGRTPLQTADQLNLGREETDNFKPFHWAHVPSEARAEKYAEHAAGVPKGSVIGEMETIAIQNARDRIDGILNMVATADTPSSTRRLYSGNYSDVASKDFKATDPRNVKAWNESVLAEKLGLPKVSFKSGGREMLGVPGRRVEKAAAQHDAQLVLDRARASLSPGDYKQLVKDLKPVLQDILPGLRYGIAAGGVAGLEEMQRARSAAQEKR